VVPIDGILICGSNFLASTNWRTYLRLFKNVENKKEKAELEREMKRTMPQSSDINKLRMIRHKK